MKLKGREIVRRHGIRKRWLINSIGVVVLITGACVFAFYLAMASSYYSSMQSNLESKAKASAEFFTNYVTDSKTDYYQSVYKYTESFEDRNILELQFVDINGTIESSTYGITAGTSPNTPEIQQAVETLEISSWRGNNPETGEAILAVSSPLIYSDGQVIGVMRYVTSLDLVESQITFFTIIAVCVGIAVVAIVICSNMLFIGNIIEDISQVTKITNRISDGSYGIQLDKIRNDEIGELTDAINNMSMKINQSEKMKTEFISSVSHELRTPLTAITGWGETLLYDEELGEDQRRGLEIIHSEAKRLTNLVEELLEFTRMEDGRFTLDIRQMDITDVCESAIFSYGEFLRRDGIDLEYMPYSGEIPMIAGDPERLKQVFYNVLDNAFKHGKKSGKITVSMDIDEQDVYVIIRDNGPGIPVDELDNVKMKFYKGSSKERGSGIGLAVCEEIIGYHNGELILENVNPGLEVTIKLPLR